jgi:hypothetical protein
LQGASFDGLASFMQVNTSNALYNFLHNATGGTVITVFRHNANINQSLLATSSGSSDIGFRFQKTTANAIFSSVTNGAAAVASQNLGNVNINEFNFVINRYDAANATLLNRLTTNINGGVDLQGNATSGTFSSSNSTNNLILGRRPALNDQYLSGIMEEIIIINAQPTPTQLTQIQTYLTSKYGTFPI